MHLQCLTDQLQRIFACDLVATRAEVWNGPNKIMQIDDGGIAALVRLSEIVEEPALMSSAVH